MTPEGWHHTTLNALAAPGKYTCVGGPFGSSLTSKDYVDNGVPVIRGANLAGPGRFRDGGYVFVTQAKADELHRNLAYPGDLIFTQRGTLGQVGQVPIAAAHDRFVVSQSQMKLTVDNNKASTDYVYQYFCSPVAIRHLETVTIGTGVPHINLGILQRWPILLPPLPEQRKIAAILSAVDEVIEKTEAVIESLQTLKKAMMQELLTRGLPGRHTRFKQTEIGEIPEEWGLVTLGDVTCESAFGPRFPATQYKPSGRYGTLRTTDVSDDWEIDYRTIPRADLPPDRFDSHRLRAGDLLVTRSGTCGVVCVFEEQPIPVIPAAFLIRFRLNEFALPWFIRLAMMTPSALARVQGMAAGGVQQNLSGTNLRRLALALPSIEEQRLIIAAMENIRARVLTERACLAELRATRAALMSVLLTGELRVTPDEGSA